MKPSSALSCATALLLSSCAATKSPGAAPPVLPIVPVPGYAPQTSAEFIAPTAPRAPKGEIKVYGEPRMAVGHPCTLWDQTDIDDLKAQLKTSQGLQSEYARLKTAMDRRIAQPLGVPVPQQDAAGNWMYPGDFLPGTGTPARKVSVTNETNAGVISDLGTMYVLSGDPKYGEFAKNMLVAYATGYAHYGHPAGWTHNRYRSAQDGRLTGQYLEDGGWLIQAARGYDLVYNLPSWTQEERDEVRDLFEAIAAEFVDDILGKDDYLGATNNRSVICNAGVLMAGYASDDQKLINYGLYGKNGTKDQPTGGVFGKHFGPECICSDGMWNEGAPGYQFMALGALEDDAETLWRHGINMYSYRNAALKGLFDSPLELAYPDLTLPGVHDSSRISLFTDWFTDCQQSYEYGYLRYHDPAYLAIINKVAPHLRLSIHTGPTSAIFDRDPSNVPTTPSESVNFNDTGYGILRLPTPEGTSSLIMEYGPSRSHSHPDKLSLDFYGQGDVLMPDPGSVFPYNYVLNDTFYHTSLGHCVLVVDQKDQIYFANAWNLSRNQPTATASQLVYEDGASGGLERAASDTVYPGVTLDRSLFLTPTYVADLFGGFSTTPHRYDLAWHIRGTAATNLPLTPFTFDDPKARGYDGLIDVQSAATDQTFTVTMTRDTHHSQLVAAAAPGTQVIVGTGWYRMKTDEKTPAIIERQDQVKNVLYGNAVDYSDAPGGTVQAVTRTGGLDAGYGLLQVQTKSGTDLCFASYRPGTYTDGGLTTDALQAMALRDGNAVRSLYLGGGTTLQVEGASITRSAPGLASVEKQADGTYLVSNTSSSDATVTVTLPELAGLSAFAVDGVGHRGGAAQGVTTTGTGGFELVLTAGEKVAFAKVGK